MSPPAAAASSPAAHFPHVTVARKPPSDHLASLRLRMSMSPAPRGGLPPLPGLFFCLWPCSALLSHAPAILPVDRASMACSSAADCAYRHVLRCRFAILLYARFLEVHERPLAVLYNKDYYLSEGIQLQNLNGSLRCQSCCTNYFCTG